MSGRKIYSNGLKLEIVKRYLQGDIGILQLADEYGISSKACIQKWVAQYNNVVKQVYVPSMELIVEISRFLLHNTGASLRQTAAHFNIPSKESANKWERIYYEEGKETLYEERRGRASKMGAKRSEKLRRSVEANEDLLAGVQRLRKENEYLKKLNALVQKREKSEKPTK